MAGIMQAICLLILMGMSCSSASPSNDVQGSTNNDAISSSLLTGKNKIVGTVNQGFFNPSLFSKDLIGAGIEEKKKLDAVKPVCTTTTNSPSKTAIRKNRGKELVNTKTTTCVKELIINGQKHLYKETKVINEKGIVVSRMKGYQTVSINKTN